MSSLRSLAPLALVGCMAEAAEGNAVETPRSEFIEKPLMEMVRTGLADQLGQTLSPLVPVSKLTDPTFLVERCGSTREGKEILNPNFYGLAGGVEGAFQVTGVERVDQMQKQATAYLFTRDDAPAMYDAGALRALAQRTYELETASDDTVRLYPKAQLIVQRGWSDKALVADHPVEHRVAADLQLAIGAFNEGTGLRCQASDFFVDRTSLPVTPPSLEQVCKLEVMLDQAATIFESPDSGSNYFKVWNDLQQGIHKLGFGDEEQKHDFYKNYLYHYAPLCTSLAGVAVLEKEAAKDDPRWAAMGAHLQHQHHERVQQFKGVYGL